MKVCTLRLYPLPSKLKNMGLEKSLLAQGYPTPHHTVPVPHTPLQCTCTPHPVTLYLFPTPRYTVPVLCTPLRCTCSPHPITLYLYPISRYTLYLYHTPHHTACTWYHKGGMAEPTHTIYVTLFTGSTN